MKQNTNSNKRPVVKLKPHTYQPNKAELKSDLRIPATFEQAVTSLDKPVAVTQIRN